jgi:glycosyltransferase involved in cell wall biosynthesis
MTLISIVVPCHNEELVVAELHSRLRSTMMTLPNFDFEILFVDDGSRDSTREIIQNLVELNSDVKLIVLSRNFGHQLAVSAGIDYSNGDAIVLIDADLQDPPEVITSMVEKWTQGADVVYGVRTKRKGESLLKKSTAKYFYRLLRVLSGTDIPADTGDFRLISRRVADVLKDMPERDRFLRGMVSWTGFNQVGLPYERDARFAGKTKYSMKKMITFAADAIFSFSTAPLRLAILLGLLTSLLAFAGIVSAVYGRLFTDQWVEGWTFTIITIFFMGGIQLVTIGILGEYLGRLYLSSKARPLYVVKQTFGR